MKYFTSLSFVFTCLTTIWLPIRTVEAIVGGEEARPGQFKYQISLFNHKDYICGGVLLNKWHALSAAQCVIFVDNNFIDGDFVVVAGALTFDPDILNKNYAQVERIYVPKSFRFSDRHALYTSSSNDIIAGDITVLKLRTELNSPDVEFVKWLESKHVGRRHLEGSQLMISGYGYRSAQQVKDKSGLQYIEYNSQSVKLKYAVATLFLQQKCRKMYGNNLDGYTCAQLVQRNSNFPEGTCKGDEGSGLVLADRTLVGILVKTTPDCNESKAAALYTRISSYIQFIVDATVDKKSSDTRVHYMPVRQKKKLDVNNLFSKLKI